MTENTEENGALVPLNQINAIEVFSAEKGLDPLIKQIRDRVNSEEYDVTTEEGRARMRSVARKIGSSKAQLEKMAKELTEDWRTKTKAVTLETTRMKTELDALRDEVKRPADEFKAKEDGRIKEHESRLVAMADTANFDGFKSPCVDELSSVIETLRLLNDVAFDDKPYEWEEFTDRAFKTYEATRDRLVKMRDNQINLDKEAAELKRLQDEEAERKAKEERERIAKEAADKATREAEERARIKAEEAKAKAKVEQERITQEKIDAEQREKDAKQALMDAAVKSEQDALIAKERQAQLKKEAEEARISADKKAEDDKNAAIEAERKRIADEDREKKAKDDARAADKEHRGKINREAMEALNGNVNIDIETSKTIVTAIAKGLIPNVTINY